MKKKFLGRGHLAPLIQFASPVFGHITRLPEDTPAHQALRCHVDLTLGHLPDQSCMEASPRPSQQLMDWPATQGQRTTTTRYQLTCGEDPPHVVIREWRYGPRRRRIGGTWPIFAFPPTTFLLTLSLMYFCFYTP